MEAPIDEEKQQKVQDMFEEASRLKVEGELYPAIDLYLQVLELDPDYKVKLMSHSSHCI